MNIKELEKENRELKEKIETLNKWIAFYQENETRRMWMDASNSSPQRSYEINRNYRMEQLPKL